MSIVLQPEWRDVKWICHCGALYYHILRLPSAVTSSEVFSGVMKYLIKVRQGVTGDLSGLCAL